MTVLHEPLPARPTDPHPGRWCRCASPTGSRRRPGCSRFDGLVDGREHLALGLGDRAASPLRPATGARPPAGAAAQRVPHRRRVRQPSAATAGRSCARRSSASPRPAGTCSTCARRVAASGSTPSSTPTRCRTTGSTPTRPTSRSGSSADERDYTVAAQMLGRSGRLAVALLSNNPDKAAQLARLGVTSPRSCRPGCTCATPTPATSRPRPRAVRTPSAGAPDPGPPPTSRRLHCDLPTSSGPQRPRKSAGKSQKSGWERASAVQVEPVELHHLDPGGDEVAHELLLRVVAGVDLRQGPQLRVRAEDQVDGRGRPPDLTGGGVAGRRRRSRRSPTPSTPCPARAGCGRSRWSAARGAR